MLFTDVCFLVYWPVTALHLLPAAWLYKDYRNPLAAAWNWSFLPLDLSVSASGFVSLALYRRGSAMWRPMALISLALTFCSGLQAIAFWVARLDFELSWWLPNLFLLVFPLCFILPLMRSFREDTCRR